MAKRKPDFSGWATKYGIKCSDGRTILPGAFKDQDGKKVPIVYGHIHDDPDMILGHAYLYSRPEGMWTEGFLNGNPKAMSIKGAMANEDIDGLSIYANELEHVNGRQVQHGNIRELSIVLAGANKGATIESITLEHDGFSWSPEDEAIIYNDDMPLVHDDVTAKAAAKKAESEQEDDEDDEGQETEVDYEALAESLDDLSDEQREAACELISRFGDGSITVNDAGEFEGENVDQICQALVDINDDQADAIGEIIGAIATGEINIDDLIEEDEDDDDDDPEDDADDGESEDGEDDDTDDADDDDSTTNDGGDDDSLEHSKIKEDNNMRRNMFSEKVPTPDEVLSHSEQVKIIQRGIKLGSMKQAWEEALESNDALQELKHDVFNDDGTKQTYGIANIDYLFPDYYELNERPDFIRRPDDWVNVILNGVYKTPRGRLRTTHANITMDEARAKGYTKGNRKVEEVFNLLRRSVDPQTIYKKQKFDRDDVIDIDDFDVIAWTKAEMKDMLNEEIARAILVGDGRSSTDPDKIFENHIRPIVNDDDLYAVKVTVVPGQDDATTANNAIRSMIKDRRFYKGSGNLIFFTSESWLAEWLLLEDKMGREKYADATALAKKMRVNRIVTCPFLDDLVVDGQQVMGIAVDLKDYATGTPRRGKVEFFDDFDIDFNQYKYLIETRLSGMLRKPYSAMILKVGTAAKGAPHYDEATLTGNENPKALHLYEHEGTVYRPTADATVLNGKTYYERSTNVPQEEPAADNGKE